MSLPNKYIEDDASALHPCGLHASQHGDPRNLSLWFPLRIFHSSEKRQAEIEQLLQKEACVERTYVPRNLVDAEQRTYVPALTNYIFVRTTLEDLRQLKADTNKYGHLRYIMQNRRDDHFRETKTIAYVPDRQMDDFIRVIDYANEQVVMIENMAFACKPGQQVCIRRGPSKELNNLKK